MRTSAAFFALALLLGASAHAQMNFVGIRFGTDVNYFHLAENYPLTDGVFTTFKVGALYRNVAEYGSIELGLTLNHKSADTAKFALPLVMQNYTDNVPSMGQTTVEVDFKVGPRLGFFFPRTGLTAATRLRSGGLLELGTGTTDTLRINRLALSLPIGGAFDFRTGYGQVGVGLYYNIGLNNVIRNPGTYDRSLYDGGKMRSVTLEITTTFGR